MEKKKLTRTINAATASGQEIALQELNKQITNTDAAAKNKPMKRLNMEIGQDLYDQIEAEIEETGQTIKGFFVMLAKQHFKSKQWHDSYPLSIFERKKGFDASVQSKPFFYLKKQQQKSQFLLLFFTTF